MMGAQKGDDLNDLGIHDGYRFCLDCGDWQHHRPGVRLYPKPVEKAGKVTAVHHFGLADSDD